MAKGHGMMPGMNMNNLIKQAQKMQKQMADIQESMGEKTLEATVGGGAVKVIANGNKQIQEIIISKDLLDPDEAETLQDMLVSGVNLALQNVEAMVNTEMSKITGGMGLPPGMF